MKKSGIAGASFPCVSLVPRSNKIVLKDTAERTQTQPIDCVAILESPNH
jgi:hypothetical protein